MPERYHNLMLDYWIASGDRILEKVKKGFVLITPEEEPRHVYVSSKNLPRISKGIQRMFGGREPLRLNVESEKRGRMLDLRDKSSPLRELVFHLPEEEPKEVNGVNPRKKNLVSVEEIRRYNAKYGFINGDLSIMAYLGIKKG